LEVQEGKGRKKWTRKRTPQCGASAGKLQTMKKEKGSCSEKALVSGEKGRRKQLRRAREKKKK